MTMLCSDGNLEECHASHDNEATGGFQQSPKRPQKSVVTLGKILRNQSSSSSNLSLTERIDKELDYYTHSPTIETDCCPLSWWKDEQKRLPLLLKVARKYLCICATSISSERIVSTGGNIVSDNRTCLKPHMVDHLVFLSKICNLNILMSLKMINLLTY